MEENICHSCGHETDWVCEQCEQWVCEKCTVPYTYTNPVDYTLCQDCSDQFQEEYANEKIEEEKHMKFIESLSELQYKDYIGKDYVGNLLKISKKNLQK